MKRIITIAGVVLLVTLGAACGSKASGTGDSPVGNQGDNKPWDIVSSPDNYPNIATRCDPYQDGKRFYIVTHTHTDVAPVIVDDPTCSAAPR